MPVLLVLLTTGSGFCRELAQNTGSPQTMSTAEIAALLKQANVRTTAANPRVLGAPPSVTVLAEAQAKQEDQDLKIDAVFLAKALIEGSSGQIDYVEVVFSQPGKLGRFVTIGRQTVADYGSGKVSAGKLLASITLHSAETSKVAPGREFARRLSIWRRIEKLREQGADVRPLEMLFEIGEVTAKSDSAPDLHSKLKYLESKVTGQEDTVRRAKTAVRSIGASRTSGSQSMPASPSQGLDFTPSGSQRGGSGGGFVPPHADRLRATYTQQADNLIRQVAMKSSQDAQRLRELKQRIDQEFNAGRMASAFGLLHQFQMSVANITGSDPFGPPPDGSGGMPGMGGSAQPQPFGQPPGNSRGGPPYPGGFDNPEGGGFPPGRRPD